MPNPRVPTSTFYTKVEILKYGYLHKSPPSGPLKSMKSWKRRFFVLLKINTDCYSLKYFKSEKKEKLMGEISVSDISILLFCPENHSMWGWIQDTFRCPITCVLLLRATGRDYFLIGENSWETDGWFNAIYDALKSRPDMLTHEDMVKLRAHSAPPAPGQPEKTELDNGRKIKSMSLQYQPTSTTPSMQEDIDIGPSVSQQNIHDIPKITKTPVQVPKGMVKSRACSAPPAPGQPEKTELGNDRKNKCMSLPCGPSLQEEDIGPPESEQHIYDIPKTIKAPLQVPKNDDKKERTDDGIYMDMAALNDLAEKTEEKAPSVIVDSEDSDFYSDSGRWDRLSTKDAKADGCKGRGPLPSVELEVCVSQEDLKKHLNLTLDVEKLCKRDSLLLRGDEIVAVNDLCIESMGEVEYYLSKLRKDEVTLTIRRLSNEIQTMRVEHCPI